MARFTDLVPQNVAPPDVRRIRVYSQSGSIVGKIGLRGLKMPEAGDKLYSFGALSDVHYQYDTAAEDFQRALVHLNETEGVVFTCICGDLTQSGTEDNLAEYKSAVDAYSPDTPVYAITGNHEGYNANIESIIETYTGRPLYYSFEHEGDVFVMVGIKSSTAGALFADGELQWLYETLEANRNRRCFVFQHVRPDDACGNAYGIYDYDIWDGTEKTVFESLMSHYENVVLFHGHSHLRFDLQAEYGEGANIDNLFGCWSVHIPSISVPRDGDASGASSRVEIYAASEGYVVDVYADGILLRGRDFVGERFLPIATYWLDTALKEVEAGIYSDSTGTIETA